LGNKKGGETVMEISEWKANLERARERKDAFFAQHWQSPIPPQERPRFKGLEYYPPDPSYRFELELHEHPEKQAVRMAYTKGNEQDFLRWGEFRFKIGGKEQALQAYKSHPREEMLFISFKDATSGKETYGAGRYSILSQRETALRMGNGFWILASLTIHGVYIAKLIPVLLCPARIGSKFQSWLVRKITL